MLRRPSIGLVCCALLVAPAGCGGGRDADGGDPGKSTGGAGAAAGHGGTTDTAGHGGTTDAAGASGTGGSNSPTAASGGSVSAAGTGGGAGSSAGMGEAGRASSTGGRMGGRGGRGNGANAGAGNGGQSGGTGMAGAPGSAGSGDIEIPDGYTLVWHDEFDVDGAPDPKNWKFETGFVRNEEDQWYQKDNATVEGGLLVIEGRKEQVKNPNYTGSGDWKTSREYAEYTSSSLNTSGLQSFQYGRFEMRARIPTSSGMWPAWWTLGVSGEWPSNGEIDIMEFYQGKVLANVACGTSTQWQAKWDSATQSLASLGANWSNDFHVWRMDWDDQNIVLMLDEQTMNTSALSSMLNADGKSPFKQKAYLLVNLALGGNNGGSLSGTTFPVRYEVDYVRVFQKK
ncbi:MAG TPA: glycoside hydrolase family 16 protein [Polyangiaceae bacterium]|jgi:beta-glucanase (GH16 family)|nr:glycoside hydrolase family 16 protein [Polyangiaceae bacterium]